MVKKVNKLMTIVTLVGAGVVGVNSAELVAINVNAYQTSSMHYLSIKWESYDSDRLMIKYGDGYQDDFLYLLDNKSAIFGSQDVYINLKGTYNLYFADHHNYQYQNYVFGDIIADSIMFDYQDMRFLLNGDLVATFDMYDIQSNLNFSENAYIFRRSYDPEDIYATHNRYYLLQSEWVDSEIIETDGNNLIIADILTIKTPVFLDGVPQPLVESIKWYVENDLGLFGWSGAYIDLNGTHDIFIADSVNDLRHTSNFMGYANSDEPIAANGIVIFDNKLSFVKNGSIEYEVSNSDILEFFDNPSNYYITRRYSAYDDIYLAGYNDARDLYGYYSDGFWYTAETYGNDQYSKGYIKGREDYGLYLTFDNEWVTAEWYGDYMFDKALDMVENDPSGFGGLLSSVFIGLGSLLSIEILPGIYIGAIVAVPLVFGIIFFILGKRKGD